MAHGKHRPVRHFPIFLDLASRHVYVLGEGSTAERKADAVRSCGAIVRRSRLFEPALLAGAVLAIGADAPETDLAALSAAAQALGIPVNIVDRAELCSYITPAVIDRDPITIAVGSGGTAPVLARMLRARIEALIPPAFGRLAALADRFRTELRQRLPNQAHRRRLLERILTGPTADMVFAGDEAAAAASFAAAIAAPEVETSGIVFLVGAGPGSADLLTLRAQRLLGEADVIVHDRLVSPEVLDMARRDAERIYVGKARAHHCMKQSDINDLLIRLARQGRKVVRLKGGDPFVFGRGGEEAEALHQAGLRCEIVPGITAALACAAQARIPLTHRAAASSLIFVTGHTSNGRLEIDFATLARAQATIAVYMGITALPALRDGLFEAGLLPATPAVLIERGGQAGQRVLFGTLEELAAQAPAWSTQGPTLILIGPAVNHATPGTLHVAPKRFEALSQV